MPELPVNLDAEVERVRDYALRTASELRSGRLCVGDAALMFFILCRMASGLVCGFELRGEGSPPAGHVEWSGMTGALWTLRDLVHGELRDHL